MNPTKHPLCTTVLGPPAGVSSDKCGHLHVRMEAGRITSFHRPGRAELAILNAGGVVTFTVHGSSHPVITAGVALPELAIPDQSGVQKCLRRMVQLLWAKPYEKDAISNLRALIASEFEPEVIQQAFAAVGFGSEPEPVGSPFLPATADEDSPYWLMDQVNAYAFCGMGFGQEPNPQAFESVSLGEMVDAHRAALEERERVTEKACGGVIRVIPDERLVSAVHVLNRWRLRPQDGDQETILTDGEQALVIVRMVQPEEAAQA